MSSPFARAIGLGAAKSGTAEWIAARVSAVALVPLTLWFIGAIAAHIGSGQAGYYAWLHEFPTTILMILLLLALLQHVALGLQVIVEDYVHSGLKFATLLIVRLACFALAVTGIVAMLRLAMRT
jgi:succinate dehydrogenase membrane anchor subunit